MRVEHPDTFRCDICGREVEHAESVTVPVLWKTEQNEGRPCEPYIACERLDLCEECLHSVLAIEAIGCIGNNTFSLIELSKEKER